MSPDKTMTEDETAASIYEAIRRQPKELNVTHRVFLGLKEFTGEWLADGKPVSLAEVSADMTNEQWWNWFRDNVGAPDDVPNDEVHKLIPEMS